MGSNFVLNVCAILITELMVLSTVPLSKPLGIVDCQMVNNTDYLVNYQLTLTFGREGSSDESQ